MSDILTQTQVKVPGDATEQGRRDPRGRAAAGRRRGGDPAYVDAMFEREKSVSTYMGNFLAIPHGTNEAKDTIGRSAISVVRYDAPIDWDGNEVRFAVGIAGVENGHLEILGKIAIVFSDSDEVEKLLAAGSAEELYADAPGGQRGLNALGPRATPFADPRCSRPGHTGRESP